MNDRRISMQALKDTHGARRAVPAIGREPITRQPGSPGNPDHQSAATRVLECSANEERPTLLRRPPLKENLANEMYYETTHLSTA
jgi:hypothetical protein